MRSKKLFVFTAVLVLIGGLSSCGKEFTPLDKSSPPTMAWEATNLRLKAKPSELKSAVTQTKNGQKSTIILKNGQNGDATFSKIESISGDKAKLFVRPDYGYEPDKILLNGTELSGFKGNYELNLIAGENNIDVSYKNIQPILSTVPETYSKAFEMLKTIAIKDEHYLTYDGENTIMMANTSAAHVKNITQESVQCMVNLSIDKGNTTGKFVVDAILAASTNIFQYSALIDAKTFNEKTKYSDLEVTCNLVKPTTEPNERTQEFREICDPIFVNSIDTLLKRNTSHSGSTLKLDLYSLGFYHYPGRFEVEYVPEEFLSENSSLEYATSIAKIKNNAISNLNPDNALTDFRMNGIEDYIYKETLGNMTSVYIFIFKDHIRFLGHTFGEDVHLYDDMMCMSIDVSNDGSEKVKLTGFLYLLSDRKCKPLSSTASACFEIILEEPLSITGLNFNLTNNDLVRIYFESDKIEQKNKFILSDSELNLVNNRLMHTFRKTCINFSIINEYDLSVFKVCQKFTSNEALEYDTYNLTLDNSKEVYKKWHQDLNKYIRKFDDKDETTTDLVEVTLKDIYLPESAKEVVNINNGTLPKVILRSQNNRIQFGIICDYTNKGVKITSIINLPDENQTSFDINHLIKYENNHAEIDYYHRILNLNDYAHDENLYDLFKCYKPTSINEDLSLASDAKEITPTIGDELNQKFIFSILLEKTLTCLFSGFANYELYLSYGLTSCNEILYYSGGNVA